MPKDPEFMQRVINEADETKTASRKSNENMWKTLAGENVHEMLLSREKTINQLGSPSWKIRLAALSILRTVWKPDAELARMCEKMAFDDTDIQVRGTALFTLAFCYRGTNDLRIGQMLRLIVCDTSMPNGLRQSAYTGLFQLRGVPSQTIPIPGTYEFPSDVNWDFVASFEKNENKGLEKRTE